MKKSDEKIILYLLGIDKKWIRDKNQVWTEYIESKTEVVKILLEEETDEKPTKKWWQFWIKNNDLKLKQWVMPTFTCERKPTHFL